MFGQFTVLLIHFHHTQGRNCSFELMRRDSAGPVIHFIQQEKVGFPFFIFIQQVYGLKSFLQVIHHIIAQVGLKHILQGCAEFFIHIQHI